MKRFLYLLSAISLFVLAAVSCDEVMPSEPDQPQSELLALSLKANIATFTKATDTAFETSDTVGVSILVPEWDDDKSLHAHNVPYSFLSGGSMTTDTPVYWYDDREQRAFVISYYPYSYDYDIYEEWVFTVNADQSNHYAYTNSDLMFACTESKPTKDEVKLTYNHLLSKVVVYIDNQLEDKISDVFVSDVYGSVKVDVDIKGAAEYTVNGSKGTIKMCPATDVDGRNLWAAIIVPQSDSDMKLIVTTAADKQYTFTLSEPVTFEAGTKSTAEIALEESSVSTEFTPEISDWLPGNDLNFGQKDENNTDSPSDIPVMRKKLYYSTGYMDVDSELGTALLWCEGKVQELPLPEDSTFACASGVVRDIDGNILVGGFYDAKGEEWNAVMWTMTGSSVEMETDNTEEVLIVDMDITESGEVIQCRYGADKEYYIKGDERVDFPEGFCATSVCVKGEDIYFSGYYTADGGYTRTAAYVVNDKMTLLPDGERGDFISVYAGSVYIAGTKSVSSQVDYDRNNDGVVNNDDFVERSVAVLWIDGEMQSLVSDQNSWSDVGGLFVDAGGVYVAVNAPDQIILWNDGKADVIWDNEDVWVYDMYVLDDVVYLGGFRYGDDSATSGPSIWTLKVGESAAECTVLRTNATGERGRFNYI